jgi:Spy/CpxP family protein refolding chaperone
VIKSKLFILLVFAIALGAGITLGMLCERRAFVHSGKGPPFIARELNLTEDQDIKMHAIWSKVMESHGQRRPRREAILKQKDEALAGLLTADQKTRFTEIVQEFDRKQQELDQEMKRIEDQAVLETSTVLTEPQRKKFEEMRKAHDEMKNKPEKP